jgi:malate dehydrogenase
MITVCIIGSGDLGGAIAHALARGRVARIVIVDESAAVAAGKALDIQQSGAIAGSHAQLEGTHDLTRIIGCAACVIADRFGQPSTEWQGDAGLEMLRRLLPNTGDAPLVFAGAQQAPLLLAAAREAGVKRERLIGSAPEALASAITAIVAMEARCAPGEISLAVLGTPPAGFVVPWSEATVGGYALDRVLTQVQLARIEARATRLWPPGPFTLGLAAARVAEAVLGASRRAHGVLTVLGGEFGVRDRIGTLPVLLSSSGIVHVRVPVLNTRERVRLENALSA